jgi:Lrp/AsnC family transcriptional regulator for asnA, asnC and gidA
MAAIAPLDKRIVDLLMEDGRMPCAELARRIGDVSERTVRYRLDRMVRQGLLRLVAIPNPKALGYSVIADVFLEVEPGAILEVARKMAEYECVSYVGCSMGDVDVSIQVVAHDNDEVYAFVTEVVANVPGVRKTTTLIVPRIVKDVYQWQIPPSACTDAAVATARQIEMPQESRPAASSPLLPARRQ